MNDLILSAPQIFLQYFHSLLTLLANEPEIAVFLAVGTGFYIGKIKFGPVQLGGVCGTLIMSLLLGQSGVVIPPAVKSVFFALFIFALGYAGGPQFFSNLNAKGLRLGVLSIIEVVVVLFLALSAMRIFGFDAGTTAGLVAGAATESAVIGTASEALSRLPLPHETISAMQSNVVTVYSITYIFGLICIVVFTSQVAPLLLKVNLRQEAERVWLALGGDKNGTVSNDNQAAPEMEGRVYRVNNGAGRTVAEINESMGATARIERVSRKGTTLELGKGLILTKGDRVLVMGHRGSIVNAEGLIGPELTDARSLNMLVDTEEYVLGNTAYRDKSLGELTAYMKQSDFPSEVYLAGVVRDGNSMPMLPTLTLQLGDVLQLFGSAEGIAALGKKIGKRIEKNDRTNFVYMGLGVVAGVLIGQISIPVGGINLTLGTGGGALLSGLTFGWFQARHPSIPGTPPSSLEIMKDLGLSTFVACVGLSSGPQAFALVAQYGVKLPLVGICIALVPALLSLAVGRLLLKIEIPVLLGGIAGQQCSTPALSAVQAAAGNTTPLIGYTITYAISNAILPLLGPVIVGLAMLTQTM